MTPEQRTVLAAAIRANPATAQLCIDRNDSAIKAWLDAYASPVTKAWITAQPIADSDDAPDYSTFDALVAGKRDSWGFFLRQPRDFTRSKVRKWVTDIWGAATAGSNAEAILLAATRKTTNCELIFGGTDSTTGTVTAKKLVFEGSASSEDVGRALNDNP